MDDIREAIQNIINQMTAITSIRFTVSDSIPTVGSYGRIYFVASTGLMNDNIFDVYVFLDGYFRKIISEITLDVTGYVYKDEMVAITNQEIDEMF